MSILFWHKKDNRSWHFIALCQTYSFVLDFAMSGKPYLTFFKILSCPKIFDAKENSLIFKKKKGKGRLEIGTIFEEKVIRLGFKTQSTVDNRTSENPLAQKRWEWLSRERVGLKIQTVGNEYSIELTWEWMIRKVYNERRTVYPCRNLRECPHLWPRKRSQWKYQTLSRKPK